MFSARNKTITPCIVLLCCFALLSCTFQYGKRYGRIITQTQISQIQIGQKLSVIEKNIGVLGVDVLQKNLVYTVPFFFVSSDIELNKQSQDYSKGWQPTHILTLQFDTAQNLVDSKILPTQK